MPDAAPARGIIIVRGSGFTLALVVMDGKVTEAAPLARRWGVLGQDARQVWRDLAAKGHRLTWVADS